MLRATLESEGHAVLEAHNGIEAIGLCCQTPPALVIMEVFLPEREGIETIVELQEQHPDVKISAVSGGGRFDRNPRPYLAAAKELGAERSFAKPLDSGQILKAVRETLL